MQQVNELLLTKLKSIGIHLDWSNLTLSEDDCVLIQRELNKNTKITSLCCDSSNINIPKLTILIGCTTLRILMLQNNDLGLPSAQILASQSHLQGLILVNTNITTEGVKIIAQNNSTLTFLEVSNNNIDNSGLTALTQIPSLRELRFYNNKPNILSSLPPNSTLRRIDLSNNIVTLTALRNLLQFSSLESLVFTDNNVGDDEAPLFLTSSLTSLMLHRNSIGPKGANELALSPTLTTLDLSWNDIGSEGAKALSKNSILTDLNVSYIKMSEDVRTKLRQVLHCNKNAMLERKKEFIWKMIVLARDAKNSDSKSWWHNLPSDIQFYILLHLDLSGNNHISKSKETVRNISRFIFDNIAIYNNCLQKPIVSTGKIFIGKSTLTKYPFKFFQNSEVLVVEKEEELDNSEDEVPLQSLK